MRSTCNGRAKRENTYSVQAAKNSMNLYAVSIYMPLVWDRRDKHGPQKIVSYSAFYKYWQPYRFLSNDFYFSPVILAMAVRSARFTNISMTG